MMDYYNGSRSLLLLLPLQLLLMAADLVSDGNWESKSSLGLMLFFTDGS